MKRQSLPLWNDKTATIPPFCLWICFILIGALQSSKGGITLTKFNLTTVSFICSQCLFQKLRNNILLHLWQKTVNACKKNKVLHHPEASLSLLFSLSLFLMYTTDNTVHKEPFLSYLSSCFRYFCKLQGARIINHCEIRWQSASIVAKKTNETTHPGKWPGDLVWCWLPTVTEMLYTVWSLLRTVPYELPWAGQGQIRPWRQTNRALCLFLYRNAILFQIWLGSV